MTQTVVLTGANGFIARHVALGLLNTGYSLRATLRDAGRAGELRDALRPYLDDPGVLDGGRFDVVVVDLDRDDGWDAAMAGADALIHTASPFPMTAPRDPQALIRPAVDGTLRALRAAARAAIGRVVLTSSSVAVAGTVPCGGRAVFGEQDWADPDRAGQSPYARSKIMAERAAWGFVEAEAPEMALTTINPALVMGAPLGRRWGTSLRVVERILGGRDPMLPRVGFPVVDVRDVAEAHLRALTDPDSAGHRILMGREFLWMPEMAAILKARYPERRIPTRTAPGMVVRALALFDPSIRGLLPSLDWRWTVSGEAATALLGHDLRRAEHALLDAAAAIVAAQTTAAA